MRIEYLLLFSAGRLSEDFDYVCFGDGHEAMLLNSHLHYRIVNKIESVNRATPMQRQPGKIILSSSK